MEAEAKIMLSYKEMEEAISICKGVSPDNLKRPRELFIETWVLNNDVITYIKYHGENIATLLSTIDDLLSCITVAERIIFAIRSNI